MYSFCICSYVCVMNFYIWISDVAVIHIVFLFVVNALVEVKDVCQAPMPHLANCYKSTKACLYCSFKCFCVCLYIQAFPVVSFMLEDFSTNADVHLLSIYIFFVNTSSVPWNMSNVSCVSIFLKIYRHNRRYPNSPEKSGSHLCIERLLQIISVQRNQVRPLENVHAPLTFT